MTNSTADILCIHCNAVVLEHDLTEGWCDSCGKRLPDSLSPRRKRQPAPAAVDVDEPDIRRPPRILWGFVAFLVVSLVALFLLGAPG